MGDQQQINANGGLGLQPLPVGRGARLQLPLELPDPLGHVDDLPRQFPDAEDEVKGLRGSVEGLQAL